MKSQSKTADQVMNKNFGSIQSGHSLVEANKIFLEKALTFAPVITPMGEFLGLLTEKNLVKMNIESQKDPKKNRVAHFEDLLIEFSSVNYQDTMEDIIGVIFSTDIYYVVVLNDGNNMVGTIDAKNMLSMISGEEAAPADLRQEVLKVQEENRQLETGIKSVNEKFRFYKNLVEDAPLFIHSVNADGEILVANKIMHETLGYPPDSLVGKTIFDIYPSANHKMARNGLKQIVEKGDHERIATSMVQSNGQLLTVRIISSSIKTEGDFIGTITISAPLDEDD